ncbi:MAG: HVO_2523 family zinc finger protein [Thermoplasmata archaeon]
MDEVSVARTGTKATQVAKEVSACDVCGAPTFERHCKIICTRCGYVRDCSDP